MHHPHIHCVVPGGGLSPDYERWVGSKPGFFLPVRVLSSLFRRLFIDALEQAFQNEELQFFGEIESLASFSAFTQYLAPLRQKEWVVYAKPPFGGPLQALEYLGRYTHRTAISNERILAVNRGAVTFQWKDYRDHKRRRKGQPYPRISSPVRSAGRQHKQQSRTMTLDVDEFLRRFLIHTLPPGFQRIRYFGFLANRHRRDKLERCRELLATRFIELLPEPVACRVLLAALTISLPTRCPKCKTGVMIRLGTIPNYLWPRRPPDTS
jgi:hypothetical protein